MNSGPTNPGPWPRRLVCVALNAAIDKTAVVDRLEPGTIHRPTVLATLPGGKAVNVARAATRLGLQAEVVAVVGGHAGEWFAAELAARDIRAHLVRVDGETRTCLSVLDRGTGELTEFYEPGVEWTLDTWPDVEHALEGASGDADDPALVVLAGSLPPGAPGDAYGRLTGLANLAGAKVVVDVDGEPLRLALAARPWLVKVNAREAATTTGLGTDDLDGALQAALRLQVAGAQHALITRGVDGAVFVGQGTWALGPPPEIGPYTVGSGDVLLAGFAVALGRGDDLPDALRYGAAAAAANALTPGQGELDPADVKRLLPRCTVERLDG